MAHPLTDLLEKYNKKQLVDMARKAGINPAGRTKWWLLSTLVQKGIIKLGDGGTVPALEREYWFSIHNWRGILKDAEGIKATTIIVRLSINPRVVFLDSAERVLKERMI